MKRKHAELIKAWADGAEIEVLDNDSWHESKFPSWNDDLSYRIKHEPGKVVRYLIVDNSFIVHSFSGNQNANLKITLIYGELVEAEILKNAN